ncbi:MAG: transposase [Candidatus Levybacteria bacterium]|nr:transposase [Candidatus Levybacteria bacterium]
MPSKYVVRNFAEDSYYHIFNRGVEKRNIFLDEKDYRFFEIYLSIYLQPLKKVLEKHPDLPLRLHNKNLSEEVELIAYCLMPNHFHLLLKQKTKDGISKLMKQMSNAYTLYFNQKHKRVGGLMQGRFKAVPILEDRLLIHIARYIHLNPVASGLTRDLNTYRWSSYPDYLGKSSTFFSPSTDSYGKPRSFGKVLDKEAFLPCSKDEILGHFKSIEDFKKFHEDQIDYAKKLNSIKHIAIES